MYISVGSQKTDLIPSPLSYAKGAIIISNSKGGG